MVEKYRVTRDASGQPDVNVFNTSYLTAKAQYASAIIKAMATAGLKENIERSVHAELACEITEEMFKQFQARDWILELPTPEEIIEQLNADVRKRTQEATATQAAGTNVKGFASSNN